MAQSSGSSAAKQTVTTAVFKPGKGIPGVRRVISKKDAKAAFGVDVENDLVWDRNNGHTLDISALPEPVKEHLRNDKNFAVKDTEQAS